MQLLLFLATTIIATTSVLARYDYKNIINPCLQIQDTCCANQMPIPNSCLGIEHLCCQNNPHVIDFGKMSRIKQMLAAKRQKLRETLCSVSSLFSSYCTAGYSEIPDKNNPMLLDIQTMLQECLSLKKELAEFLSQSKEEISVLPEVTRYNYEPTAKKKLTNDNDTIIDSLEGDTRSDIPINKRSPQEPENITDAMVAFPYESKKYCFIDLIEVKDLKIYLSRVVCPQKVIDFLYNQK